MKFALQQFSRNIARARDLVGLSITLSAQTTAILDTTDLLRSALVLAVSALDHFVHELARVGMIEIAKGDRAPTGAYSRFQVKLGSVGAIDADCAWLDSEIREKHGWLAFQQPDKIADALRLITDKELWNEVGALLKRQPSHVKAQLALIVDRRNKIAHEADLDPTVPGTRWPISPNLVEEALDFLQQIAEALCKTVGIVEFDPGALPQMGRAPLP